MAEKEYIERGAALKKIDHAINEYVRHGEIVRFIGDCRSSIIYATAADVVEVVRCKDCERCDHRFTVKAVGEEVIESWYCKRMELYVESTDYCSRGKRKAQK